VSSDLRRPVLRRVFSRKGHTSDSKTNHGYHRDLPKAVDQPIQRSVYPLDARFDLSDRIKRSVIVFATKTGDGDWKFEKRKSTLEHFELSTYLERDARVKPITSLLYYGDEKV